MNKKKHLALNFSNQGNLCDAQKTTLSQYNFGIILGQGFLNKLNSPIESANLEKVPISIFLDKSGEVKINGINDISNDNIHIYTDKKVTKA